MADERTSIAARAWAKIKRWGVVETYLGFGIATRIIFALMFVVGVILCVSLWLTDLGIGFTTHQYH